MDPETIRKFEERTGAKVNRGDKRSHRNFEHPVGIRVTVSGREGDDARHYQERELSLQLARLKARRKGPPIAASSYGGKFVLRVPPPVHQAFSAQSARRRKEP